MTITRRRLALLGAGLLLSVGCTQLAPTSFYTLAATAEPSGGARRDRGLVIGLGPVTLPAYLDRPDIVTRLGENQMQLADLHKWAEPLEPLLTRIMAQDLFALLDAEDVIPLPQRRDVPLDRVVEVEVTRLDADAAGLVSFDARWRVYGADGDTLLTSGHSVITEQGAPPPDYDAIVAAMSRAVAAGTRDIATAIAGKAPVPEPAPKRTSRVLAPISRPAG
jgi:uncharacterized lipoprotein YmbA